MRSPIASTSSGYSALMRFVTASWSLAFICSDSECFSDSRVAAFALCASASFAFASAAASFASRSFCCSSVSAMLVRGYYVVTRTSRVWDYRFPDFLVHGRERRTELALDLVDQAHARAEARATLAGLQLRRGTEAARRVR